MDKRTLALSAFQDREGFPRVSEEEVQRAEANMWNITPTSPLWHRYLAMRAANERFERTGEVSLSLDELARLPR
jgi:hypothetical protein